jgi:uncharacterized SAM-binding protein YcdF (DUF218 family)
MREFLPLIINPVPILYFLLFAGISAIGLNYRKTGRVLITIAAIWFIIITTRFIPEIMVKSLEGRYSQLSDSSIRNLADSCDIIVLGGGHTDDKSLSPNNQLSLSALSRLIEGIRVHRIIPDSKLILSGYKGRSEITQAMVLYRTALILGVDSASILLLTAPSNTRMEAEEYAKKSATKKNLVLVTSAIHMPRAMLLFRQAGINPIASPADFIIKIRSRKYPWRWIPSSSNIGMMEKSIHEYAGIIWDRMGGK